MAKVAVELVKSGANLDLQNNVTLLIVAFGLHSLGREDVCR